MNTFSHTSRAALIGLVALFCAPELASAELPVAPAPRAIKSKAERMIGRWQVVQIRDRKLPATTEFFHEYCADGSVHSSVKDSRPVRASSGTYKAVGDTLVCHTPFDSEGKENKWEVTLITVTDSEAVVSVPSGSEQVVLRLVRIQPNKK